MVQVLPQVAKKPNPFNRGLEMAMQLAGNYQQKGQQEEAAKKLGLDPSVFSLPEQAQAEYFKNAFATEKGPTPLQESQMKLNEEKLNALKGRQQLFQRLSSGQEGQVQAGTEQEQNVLSSMSENNLSQLAAFAGQPGEEGVIGNIAKAEIDKRHEKDKTRSAKEMKYFEMNEPKIEKIAETERKLNIEGARYGRLEELFSDPSKFPSSLTAALFSKEGQISDLAYSQLSPEAQEAVKLIIDSTSGIKDTYGARVTNFDLQTYLRKLPSLLNTPEGRTRVLRDLKDLNEINQIYNRGIQEVFDEAGGTDKISFSEAEKRFKKKYGGELDRRLKEFATPSNKYFTERPDPKKYLGKKIKDSETGEIFISDGNEWKLAGE